MMNEKNITSTWIDELSQLLVRLETFTPSRQQRLADPQRFLGALSGGILNLSWSHEQQDAQEFLQALLSRLSATLRPRNPPTLYPKKEALKDAFPLLAWEGLQERRLICRVCGHQTSSMALFNILTITLSAPVSSVEDLLQPQIEERLEGYRCGHCNRTDSTMSAVQIMRWPRFLLLHTPPILSSYAGGSLHKAFSVNLCDPSAVNFKRGETVYRPTGMVEHYGGSIGSGHYVAVRRSGSTVDQWLRISDGQVSRLAAGATTIIHPYIMALERN